MNRQQIDLVRSSFALVQPIATQAATLFDGHYATVGGALLLPLEQGLGDAFTPETRAAWTEMYGLVSRTMIEAARMPEAAAA